MVIFRAPEPDRHARAAVLAALGIQRRTAEINAELQGVSEAIEMHVGVNSGIASVGATKIEGAAGTRWTYTASGTTTNLAARPAALGEGGYVVLSEETRRRLGDEVETEDLGPQILKNIPQPVHVYRVKPGDVVQPAASQQRRHPRRTGSWPVRLWIGDTQYEGRAIDYGEQGLGLVSVPQALLKVGESYRIEILGAGEPRIVTGEVRRITDRGVGMQLSERVTLPDDPVDAPR